ncbi:hypothetical protein [Goodfellowiella coeruleoviolacea]|uniref:hypothetical protein n=1 Tax=Goodfellowiella coeruleoviolacea TaxID=334858 RepID=UPI0020A41406|nr:hypothetical protein [Goodfellowiella coeruleoviolacea]
MCEFKISAPRSSTLTASGVNPCWSASEENLDKIFDTYGPEILQGVEWNILRYNEGALDHALNGVLTDELKLAEHLSEISKNKFEYEDVNNPSASIFFDAEKEILVIRDSKMIHAYNFSKAQWRDAVGSRYVPSSSSKSGS